MLKYLKNLKEFFNNKSKRINRWEKLGRYYYSEIYSLVNYIIPENKKVLDLGCGTGDILAKLKTKESVGIDFSDKLLEIAKQKHNSVKFLNGNIEKENFNLKDFDYLILTDVIQFLEDLQGTFERIKKYTNPRGRLIITYHNNIWRPILRLLEILGLKYPQNFPINWLNREDVTNLLHLADFEVVKYGKRLIFPIYLPLISNFINKYIAHLPFIEKFCLIEYIVARPVDRDISQKYSVSIVIPARNEKGNIKKALDLTPLMGSFTEIIFVEGNSTDDTWLEIKKQCKLYKGPCRLKLMQQDGKGKGDAVRKGFANASGDILMILDADLTVPPSDLTKFYYAIANNKGEFINGCRLVYPMEKEAMRFLNLLGNHFFATMFTWLLGQNIKDTLCGTKVLWRRDYESIVANRKFFGDFDPFGDFDLIFGASKLALRIIDLPIRYKERTYGTTNISRFKHGLILLRMCSFAAKRIKFV